MAIYLELKKQLEAVEECADTLLWETAAVGLTLKQVHVLDSLYANDGQRPGDLAQSIETPPTSFTPILDGIEDRGFIERRPDSADRRAIRIFLTAKGAALRADIQYALGQLEAAFKPQPLLVE